MIKLNHISKHYNDGKKVVTGLNDVTLSFGVEEFVVVTGSSGSGKSTLLNILSGTDYATSGQYMVDDIDTDSFDEKDWSNFRCQNIGIIYQDNKLIENYTVKENIEVAIMNEEDYTIEDGVLTFFEDNGVYGEIIIPDGVKKIGGSAFVAGMFTAGSVILPEGAEEIEEMAFADCMSLEKIVFPPSFKIIGENAFACCYGLRSAEIPCGCKVGEGAFSACEKLSGIDVHNAVSIGESAFYRCESLETAHINENIEVIPDLAFCSCVNLNDLRLPKGLKEIGIAAFSDCKKLTEVILPDGLEIIGKEAFENCTGLRDIFIPKSVTRLGKKVFAGCKDLTVYFEQETKPEEWDKDWNVTGGLFAKKRCNVVWGWTK